MKFHETAYPDIFGVRGPHHVAKNFGNTFCQKFRQQFQKLDFFGEKNAKIDDFERSIWTGRGSVLELKKNPPHEMKISSEL